MNKKERSAHAKKLSDLGAAKGGRARASVLTPEQRSEIAKRAAQKRWAGKENPVEEQNVDGIEVVGTVATEPAIVETVQASAEMPYSMFRGTLKIGDMDVECHVLSDGRRVFTQGEVVRLLTRGTESSNLQRYLSRNPLIDNDFSVGPIPFKIPGNPQVAIGSEATLLVEICDRYIEAKERDLLRPNQFKLAAQSAIVMRACAKVGIIALIDEVTGYQKLRAKNALQLKLQAFIAEEMQEWAVMFPDTFWFELARLEGVHHSPRNRPLRWGKYVMMFVYDAIDPDIGDWLREHNPDPHFKKNHHQWLKQFGRDRVHDQILQVVTVMKLCQNMVDFKAKFAHVFKKSPLQMTFDDMNWGQESE
jgi:hypothetical protein